MSVRVDDGETIFVFPVQGDPHEWRLRRKQVTEWQDLYPGLDIMDECRHAYAWILANHPKTARGMCRFLVSWFNRAVDRGGRRVRAWEPPPEPDEWFEECQVQHAGKCGGRTKHAMQRILDQARTG